MQNIHTRKFLVKAHKSADLESLACYSVCEEYRYLLSRRWGPGKLLVFVMLNPSTATELANDPTIERCEQRARRWGYSGIHILNLFAFRATSPKTLFANSEPVGVLNDCFLKRLRRSSDDVVLAWGNHGMHRGRSDVVRDLLKGCDNTFCLRMNKSGQPVHPLYVAYNEGLKSVSV